MRCLILLLGAFSVYGQITTGSVAGFVLDPSKQAVPGATVTATSVAQEFTREAYSDEKGYFRFDDLRPSTYTIGVSAPHFAAVRSARVDVLVDSTTHVDLHLTLAPVAQSVNVSVSSLPVDSSELGAVFDQRRMESLPLNRRDFLQLALLTPGVLPPVEGSALSTRGGFAMHANGAREEYNNFLLDGVDNNDYDVNRYVLQPSVDAIQEFKIATNNYSAEYGRSAGGQVNVITRAGENQMHGFAYEYLRNRDLDARNFFDGTTKPEFIRNQFGTGLGGPIRKDRTFYFFSFDGLLERKGLTQIGTVPTAEERAGDLSALGQTVSDPFTGVPFSGNRIPPSQISPLASNFLSLFPLPNLPGPAGNYLGQPIQPDSQWQYNARVDHHFSSADLLTFRYSYGRDALTEPYAENSTDIPGFGDIVRDTGQNAMIQYVRVLNPRAVNSLILGFNRGTRDALPQNYRTDVNELWGVGWLPKTSIDFGFPNVTVAGFSQVGDVTQLPIVRASNTYQITDGLALVRGNHSVKLGIEERRLQHNGINDIYARGSLSFTGAISGSGLGDLLLGYPTLGIQATFNNTQTLRSTASDFYIQDDWKVTRNLTLNLGMRYEFNTPATDPTNRMNVFDPARDQVFQVGTNGISRSGYDADPNNFAPRVGFAFAPGHKLVLRGGYGLYFDSSMAEINTALYFNPPLFNINVFFPTETSLLTLEDPFPTTSGFTPAPSLSSLSPDLTTGYLQQWNFNIQREIGNGSISVAYSASKGTHLIRSRDINQPAPGQGDVDSRRPYPGFSNIFFSESSGDSEFQSLNVSFNHPFKRGLSLLGVYTFSKSLDDTSAFLGDTADKNFPQNSQDYHAEHALSSFDMTHRATLSAVWDLPGQSRWARNFEASTIIVAQGGQPLTPTLRFDNSNTGNSGGTFGSDRPNLLRDPTLSDPSPNEWFDTSAFALAPQYSFGNAGRNIVRGPKLFTVDVSLARRFVVRENIALIAQAEAFNLLNRANFDAPDLFADEPTTFGHIYSAKAPRQLQFSMRLRF